MNIYIYNSLSKLKEKFVAINPPKVTMYACGLTPQNHPHLGHAIAAIRFNIIRNYLEYKGYKVCYVENVTDIDDKIINRALELNLNPEEVSSKYLAEYQLAKKELNIPNPQFQPKVTEYIDKIIIYIDGLINKGYAYSTKEGDVYFSVRKKKDYGKLSGRKVDELKFGTRVVIEGNKKDDLDFALWKSDTTINASWDSPWGFGRPGWHIECSVMCNDILGNTIDIHCGGLDLIFPHHENEIAQCEAHNETNFVNYWVHCGLLNVDGRKMSKSFGNFLTISEALNRYGKELITFVVLRHHYRSSIDFNIKLFKDNLSALCDFYRYLDLSFLSSDNLIFEHNEISLKLVSEFEDAMNDDFNTPIAVTVLSKYLKEVRKMEDKEKSIISDSVQKCIINLGRTLGLFDSTYKPNRLYDELLKFHQTSIGCEKYYNSLELHNIIEKREIYRKNKEFEKSDDIRNNLENNGINILDGSKNRIKWDFKV